VKTDYVWIHSVTFGISSSALLIVLGIATQNLWVTFWVQELCLNWMKKKLLGML